MWTLRHEAALRARVAVKLQWIQDNVSLNPPGGRRMNLEALDQRASKMRLSRLDPDARPRW